MDRRNFLREMIGGIAATAAVRTWPFRVYSFPRAIVLPSDEEEYRITVAFLNSQTGQISYPEPLALEKIRAQLPHLRNGILYVRDDDPTWQGLLRSPSRWPGRPNKSR